MSKYRPYAKYQDTGKGLVFKIPEDWRLIRLRYLAGFKNSNVDKKSYEGQDQVFLCNYTDVYYNEFITSKIEFMQATASLPEIKQFALQKWDVIITKDSEDPSDIGIPAIVKGDFVNVLCGYHLTVIRTGCPATSRLIHRVLQSHPSKAHFFKEASGITRYGLGQQAIANLPVYLPSLQERASIADFIDRETARIDALITKKTRFIELLKEKRQAVITKAVTKGLDDSAEMKESGLKWLGDVPRHWSVMACKYGCSLIKDGTHLPPPRVDGGVPLLSVRNVQDGKFDFRPDDSTISESDYHELCRSFKPKANDVLLAIVGATIGKTAVVPENMGLFHLQRSLAVFRVKKKLNHLFLNFIFQSAGYQQLLWENIGFSAQPGIYLGALSSFRIPVPPLDEQLKIVEYVIDKTQRTDTLIAKTEHSIELLKEHRAALITAAVTGKIDVREAA